MSIHISDHHKQLLEVIRRNLWDNLTLGILLDCIADNARSDEDRVLHQQLTKTVQHYTDAVTHLRTANVDRRKQSRWELIAHWRLRVWFEIRNLHGRNWKGGDWRNLQRFREPHVPPQAQSGTLHDSDN